jgi:MFS family permease
MPLTVVLLSLCQALLVTGNILLVAVSPLIGATLAPGLAWSTAPVAMQWLGLMCATIPASLLMARIGRQRGFLLGNAIGLFGVLVAAQALIEQSFVLFIFASWLIGIGIGFGQLYRFAAVEAAPAGLQDRAIGLVMGGGVLAAIAGPWLARVSRELGEVPFLGSFMGLAVLYLIALVIVGLLRLPPVQQTHAGGTVRPVGELLLQPTFLLAVVTALVGYGIMNLSMTATPLAMAGAGHHFDHVASTIQWHVLAMFVPSFFTGHLVARFGRRGMIVAGCMLLAASGLAAQFDSSVAAFHAALILLGLGWNFTFLPATGLLTESYRPEEKARAQAANEFIVFTTVALSAFLAGPLVTLFGWQLFNLLIVPLAAIPVLLLAWQRLQGRPALQA